MKNLTNQLCRIIDNSPGLLPLVTSGEFTNWLGKTYHEKDLPTFVEDNVDEVERWLDNRAALGEITKVAEGRFTANHLAKYI